MICPEGFSSDGMMRYSVLAVGAFNEPQGLDCYLHQQTYNVLAGIIIVGFATFVLCVSIDLPMKRGWVLRLLSVVLVVFSLSCIGALLCGSFAPQYCRLAFAISNAYLTLIWHNLFIGKMVSGSLLLLRGISHDKTDVEILGGKCFVTGSIAVLLTCELVVLVASMGMAVTYNASDEARSLIYFQVFMLGFSAYALSAAIISLLLIKHCLSILEALGSQYPDESIKEFTDRLQKSKRMIPMLIPMASGLTILHAFALPIFWFLLLLHMINGLGSAVLLWSSLTPLTQKRRIWRILTCRNNIEKAKATVATENGSKTTPLTIKALEVVAASSSESKV